MMLLRTLLFSLSCVVASQGYTWPDDKIDSLESILVESGIFTEAVSPCSGEDGSPGSQTAAEWLRTAYHDMATANVANGTGGIDASLIFELDRAENVGAAFDNTFGFISIARTPRDSMADLVALAAVIAVRSCGGPEMLIPYRAGRVDATEAGPPGVPVPQEDLATHTADFQRQGFNMTEMIGLVACGHTIGGIHGEDFPNITAGVSHADTSGQTDHFDTTFGIFDNKIATDFISNTSVDPLAIGPDLTNSDLRIFDSDSRNLMARFAKSNEFFLAECKSLLERMINTVPRGVELSDIITPIPVKPANIRLELTDNATKLALFGQIRIAGPKGNSPIPSVFIHINRGDGTKCIDCPIISATLDPHFGLNQGGFFGNFSLYDLSVNNTFPLRGGISSFTVEIREDGTRHSQVADNNGLGFPVDDRALFLLEDSCLDVTNGVRNITIAVKESLSLSSLTLSWITIDLDSTSRLPPFFSNSTAISKGSPIGHSGYTQWNSVSKFEPHTLPDQFNSNYKVLGKDVHGKSFTFAGVDTEEIPSFGGQGACPL